MRRAWLLVLFLMCACLTPVQHPFIVPFVSSPVVRPVEVPVFVDKEFSDFDKWQIALACADWNLVLNGNVRLLIKDTAFDFNPANVMYYKGVGVAFWKTDSNNPVIPSADGVRSSKDTLAWADSIGGDTVWMIRDRFEDADVKVIAKHELGHVLGSEHVGQCLMRPEHDMAKCNCVDRPVADEVAVHYHLQPDTLGYCQ